MYENLEDDFVLLANDGKLPLEIVNNDEQVIIKVQKEETQHFRSLCNF